MTKFNSSMIITMIFYIKNQKQRLMSWFYFILLIFCGNAIISNSWSVVIFTSILEPTKYLHVIGQLVKNTWGEWKMDIFLVILVIQKIKC